ncbi:hypothetical protein OROGR_010415 [Orobanche gracilis]
MVGSAPQSQSQHMSAEEEALRRNTDCVYFLASPLTCKKGSDCEFRHSDVARVNPRDCYFWLHGNCLNPKCGFRHPPLDGFDGLLGTQALTSTGPFAPMSQAITTPTPHVPNNASKPVVPCIFFQQGYCLKGDRCPFVHMSNSVTSQVPMAQVSAPPAEILTNKMAISGLEKYVQEKKVPPVNVAKSVKNSTGAKTTFEVEPAPSRNEFAINRRAPEDTPISNGNQVNWPVRVQQYRDLDEPEPEPEPENMNSKDTEEVSREPSPGFDVLVDDDVRDSDYYPGEDRYGMSREHESRNEYDFSLSNDHNSMTAADDERYQSRPIGYDSQENRMEQYGDYEQHGGSSERTVGSYFERMPYARPDTVGQVDEIDLRQRLVKHKKPNGLRSVISYGKSRDVQAGDRSYRSSHMENHRSSSRENPLSGRLLGRISLPRTSPSPGKRDMIRGGRLSPLAAGMYSHHGRIYENARVPDIRRRVDEGYNGGKNYNRGPYSRRDDFSDERFAGPKSLAELKNRKNGETNKQNVTDQQSLGKRKHMIHQESRDDLSFEGPKPLVEILKRKRGETNRNSSNNNVGVSGDKIHEEGKDMINIEVYSSTVVQESEVEPNDSKQEAGDGMLDNGVFGVSEVSEQRDGESDYEQVGGEDYDLYDGENGDNGEYVDEDEDDDFAKKMGVMYA